MPRRILAKAQANPFMANLLITACVVAPGTWGLVHLYDCVGQDATDNAEVLRADNAAWTKVEDLLAQDAGPDTLENLKAAVHDRVELAKDLDTSNDTFC